MQSEYEDQREDLVPGVMSHHWDSGGGNAGDEGSREGLKWQLSRNTSSRQEHTDAALHDQ